ncbi:VPS13A_C [Mytilus edulis]|uniref:VPS13A_C n=1 Tax=Mytilus edulis TaxID=6550 RepID=A0A8S3RV46_MYTED|nr:VPS13A_C [Mytilus edulis]
MIKNKLDEIIKTYLGKYLDYDKDEIEYSLLQGKVELKNVRLRPEAILGKEFPLEVKAGEVEYVKIAIPWSNLLGTSTAVTLELSGLYIIAGPVADRPYDKKKDEDLHNAIKQAKLRSFEETAYQKVASQAEKNPGLFEKIWKYVLNNITITLSNIHVRYEDSITHGDYSFAMGGILNQFTVHTTDKNWQETELDSQATLLHKLGKLTNLSLYWNHCVKDLDLVGKPERIKSGKWKVKREACITSTLCVRECSLHSAKRNTYITTTLCVRECSLHTGKREACITTTLCVRECSLHTGKREACITTTLCVRECSLHTGKREACITTTLCVRECSLHTGKREACITTTLCVRECSLHTGKRNTYITTTLCVRECSLHTGKRNTYITTTLCVRECSLHTGKREAYITTTLCVRDCSLHTGKREACITTTLCVRECSLHTGKREAYITTTLCVRECSLHSSKRNTYITTTLCVRECSLHTGKRNAYITTTLCVRECSLHTGKREAYITTTLCVRECSLHTAGKRNTYITTTLCVRECSLHTGKREAYITTTLCVRECSLHTGKREAYITTTLCVRECSLHTGKREAYITTTLCVRECSLHTGKREAYITTTLCVRECSLHTGKREACITTTLCVRECSLHTGKRNTYITTTLCVRECSLHTAGIRYVKTLHPVLSPESCKCIDCYLSRNQESGMSKLYIQFSPPESCKCIDCYLSMNQESGIQKLYIQFSPPESCKCIDCYLSRNQYTSMLKWFDAVDRLRVNMKYRKYRPNPKERPVKSNCKSWWKYAYQSVLQERVRPFSWSRIVVYRQLFKDYKHLYLQHLENPNDETVTIRCKNLEYEMDVHNIMTAREDAKVEFQKRVPERAKIKKKEKSEGSWWWPWGGSQESEEEIETPDKDGIWGELSEVEKKELYDKIGYKEEADQQKLPDDYIAYKIQLEIKQFDVTLTSKRQTILKASLCEMLTSYENRPEGKGHAVTQVLSFFQMPDEKSEVDLNEIAMSKLRGFVEYSRDTLLYAIEQKSTFHISVHMKSPYIVIPQTGTLSDSEREGHVLVIDLGTFTVRSDLQDKDKTLENPSTEELHEKLYDKFLVTITEVEILVADSNEDWHLPLTMDKSQSKYHILPNSSLDIAFYKTSMADNYNHPHHKFDIKLHSLTLTVTDEQLLILYMFVFHFPKPKIIALEDQMDSAGTVPPKLDPSDIQLEPDIALLRRAKRTILSRTVIEATIPEDESVADRPYYPKGADDNFFSASDDSEDEYDKWNRFLSVRSVEDYLSDNNRMRMYIRIQIVELVIQLSLQEAKQRKEYLMFRLDPVIVDRASTMYLDKNGKPVDCGYAMYASVGAFKMADKFQVNLFVLTFVTDTFENEEGASGAYLELLRTESDKKLITFSYRQVLPKCPDFGKVYNYIENAASFTCHNVSVIFDQTVMGSLKKFADNMQERLAKIEAKVNSGPNLRIADARRLAPPPLQRQESRLSNSINQVTGMLKGMADEVDSSDRPTIKLHLVTCIKDVSLQLCNIDKHFSQMEFKGMESQLIMRHKKIVFNCRLKEMSIKDLNRHTLYPNILIIEKEDDPFFDLKVEKFNNKDKIVKKDNNIGDKLDYRVRLRIGHLQLACISKFFYSIVGFFDPFKTPEIVQAATTYRDMVSKQVTEIHPSAMRIAIRVTMHRPTIVIPKHSTCADIFMLQFRMFEIDNSFKKEMLSDGQEQDWNYFIAHLKEMEVKRGRLKENEFHMLYHIVEPVNFEATFGLALAPFRSRLMYNISGDVALIKINVQQSDIKLMFDVLRKNFKEGAPQSVQDVGSSPVARVDVVDSPHGRHRDCLQCFSYTTGFKIVSIYHRNKLSSCKIGELNIRVNTFPEADITMDVNITLHSLSLDDTKSDSKPVVKRIFYCHQISQQENLPLISVVYKSRSSGHQEADIRMDKVTINLNIPYLLALNEFYQSAFQSDVPPVDQSRQRTSLVSDQLDSSPNNSVLQVKGIVKQPKIVLFADPEKDTSRILVLDTDIEFEMYTDSSIQKIQASIKSMKMYTSLHGNELYENSVIKPCNVDFSRISCLQDNKMDYSINLPQLDIYITPTVLHLMADVTKLLTGPEKKEDDTSIEPVPETDMWSVKSVSADKWRQRIDEEGSAIDPFEPAEAPTESITLKIKKMNSYFRVRNLDYDVDLLHLKMSIDAKISDLQKQFQMTSDIQAEARYFNEKLSVWEPLIEKVSEKEGQYRPWECVMKVIRNRSYPMTFNYVQDGFSLEDTYRNNVQKLLQESKRRSSSSESETDDSIVEKTVMRHKFPRTRSRIASDKSFGKRKSLSHPGSIQGESDTEPDGLIQSITNKLGGIFSDSDSSEDADISENDDNGDLVDPSLDKPVFITSKGPVHIAMDQSMYDELDAGPQLDNTEEGEKEEPRPQSYYIIMASQDQLLLNVTPQAIDVLTDVTNVSQSYYIIMASQDQLLLNVTAGHRCPH